MLLLPLKLILKPVVAAADAQQQDEEWGMYQRMLKAPPKSAPAMLEWSATSKRDERGAWFRLREAPDGSLKVSGSGLFWAGLVCLGIADFGLVIVSTANFVDAWVKSDLWWGSFILPVITLLSLFYWLMRFQEARTGPWFDPVDRMCHCGLGPGGFPSRKTAVPFRQVAGVQLLLRWSNAHDNKNAQESIPGFMTCQLILVLKDEGSTRHRILAHDQLNNMESHATALAGVLNVPIWRNFENHPANPIGD